ncbi:hypothetical protein Q3O60_09270 [Alkalimonas collagenimarina]|uniref:Uncharacterized protein n=1 Tax=Alkalimonas collagenimarina TaxID=400390 RepID=A0ABT9GZS9_9GAMM|nr:hypothetical protein [Alkalimonas collagenimarina]MDP4536379.1 hypothetical protein [Alkalimonas collagenimarina]
MQWILWIFLGLLVVAAVLFNVVLRKKYMHLWLGSYLKQLMAAKPKHDGPKHILFCFVDHFEPQWKNKDIDRERARVDRWYTDYPAMAKQHVDADGHHPKHTFFYPEEEYRHEHLAKLADLSARGYGEIEIHLHHDNDTAENLTLTLTNFAKVLHEQHGALPVHPETGQIQYAFIHGNWALDNSLPGGKHCGVDNELKVLKDTGCYVDMTLPSAPSPAQTSTINSIYYATGRDGQCKSHDTGVEVEVGKAASGDLMILQGPLGLNFKWRTKSGMPHIENSDVRKTMPLLQTRIDQWVNSNIHVKGRPEWVFIKVHTHGAQEGDMDTLLGEPRHFLHDYLEDKYNDGNDYVLHYVSAREMYNIAKAAEAGMSGNPNDFRDYVFKKPPFKVLEG